MNKKQVYVATLVWSIALVAPRVFGQSTGRPPITNEDIRHMCRDVRVENYLSVACTFLQIVEVFLPELERKHKEKLPQISDEKLRSMVEREYGKYLSVIAEEMRCGVMRHFEQILMEFPRELRLAMARDIQWKIPQWPDELERLMAPQFLEYVKSLDTMRTQMQREIDRKKASSEFHKTVTAHDGTKIADSYKAGVSAEDEGAQYEQGLIEAGITEDPAANAHAQVASPCCFL